MKEKGGKAKTARWGRQSEGVQDYLWNIKECLHQKGLGLPSLSMLS